MTKFLGQAEATEFLGQTPFWAPDIWATSLPEERCPPGNALLEQVGKPSLRDQSAQVRVYIASGTGPVSGLHLQPRGRSRMSDISTPSLQEESLPAESTLTTETQERTRRPGLLIEANRIRGGTSSNQKQL